MIPDTGYTPDFWMMECPGSSRMMRAREDGTSERLRMFSPALLLFLMLHDFEVGEGMRKIKIQN